MSPAPAVDCDDCRDEIDHCHAVWVRHRDGHEECLAVDCRVGGETHVYVVACVDVDPGCCP